MKQVATLLSGSSIAFFIGYLAKPVLLRLFPVAAFGVFDFVVALVAVLLPVASLRYEDAVMLPDSDTDARDVLALSSILTVGTALLATLAVLLLGPLVDPDVRIWLWSIPVLLVILRLSKLSELWLTRRESFSVISSGNAAQSATMTLTRIGAGFQGAGPGGLLLGFGLGHLITALLYTAAALKSIPRTAGLRLRETARRYKRFPQYAAPAALVSALATRLPFLVLMALFGSEVLGLFGQAFNILYIPLSLVGVAIGQVFFVRAAEAHRAGSLAAEAHEVHRWLVLAAIVPLAGVSAVAPEVFSFLFGQAWRPAGEYAVWIAPWIALSAIGSPLTRVFDVLELQRRDLAVNLLGFSLLGVALGIGSQFADPIVTISLLGAAGVVARIAQVLVTLRSANVGWVKCLSVYPRPILEGAAVFLLLRLGASSLSAGGITLLLAGVMVAWLFATLLRFRLR